MKRQTVLALGDSHSRPFSISMCHAQRFGYDFHVYCKGIGMASARGLSREQNTTRSNEKIEHAFNQLKGNVDVLCFNFGQVDAEYVYTYRSVVKDIEESFEDFTIQTLERYFEGIDKYAQRVDKVVIKGVNYPVIMDRKLAGLNAIQQLRISSMTEIDHSTKSDLKNKIKDKTPHFPQRRKRARQFNKQLSNLCRKNGFAYFDILEQLLEKETGAMLPEFRPIKALDHHLVGSSLTQRLYLDGLQQALNAG